MKRCTVVFAIAQRQWQWVVLVPSEATVAEVLAAARVEAQAQGCEAEVPWDADVGIFGELCERSAVPADGDRIELYRPLKADPKESRRERVRAGRAAQDREAAQRRSAVPKPQSR